MTRDQVVRKHFDIYVASLAERRPDLITYVELDKAVPETAASPEILDGQVQKALVLLLKQKLDADPAINQRFLQTTKVPLWNQLLAAARIKELARARIVKKGGRKQLRYDVADLAKTFFGKALLTEAGLVRQKVLDKDELAQLQAACAKVKLTLPETIEPTTTEIFFDEAIADQVSTAKAAKAAAVKKPSRPRKPTP
ncbi:MAG: hypothetical protein H0T79_06375 [Deltaproteobacteria bacterium]|nr:hypothetical protein [Deltaproteobacteria bacterium]